MSRRLFGMALFVALALPAVNAYADHLPPGHPGHPGGPGNHHPGFPGQPGRPGFPGRPIPGRPIPLPSPEYRGEQQVALEAQNLNSQVQYSNLHYSVKDEVNRFTANAIELDRCTRRPVGRGCEYARAETLRSFELIERYLTDTYYSNPAIYQQYERTRQAVDQLRYDNGNQPGRILRAVGILDVVHFNFAGYSGFEIQNQCLNLGYANRLSYVRGVVVNGQRLGDPRGGYLSLAQACGLVAQYAR